MLSHFVPSIQKHLSSFPRILAWEVFGACWLPPWHWQIDTSYSDQSIQISPARNASLSLTRFPSGNPSSNCWDPWLKCSHHQLHPCIQCCCCFTFTQKGISHPPVNTCTCPSSSIILSTTSFRFCVPVFTNSAFSNCHQLPSAIDSIHAPTAPHQWRWFIMHPISCSSWATNICDAFHWPLPALHYTKSLRSYFETSFP